ncbi:RES family NAD+ phosphorylase [Clostridium botulinum]|nr:RES family NAD+ phosphorylase [Clostridium botulinum]
MSKYRICINCVKEEKLERYIKENGDVGQCFFCKEINKTVNFEADYDIKQLVKALIRYYYDGVYYSSRFGIQDAENLLLCHNAILDVNRNESETDESKKDALELLIGNYYEDYDKGVSIVSGERFHMGPPVRILDNEFLSALEERLEKENFYYCEDRLVSKLEKIIDKVTVECGTKKYYRARIGYEKKCILHVDGIDAFNYEEYEKNIKKYEYYVPYTNLHIGAPLPRESEEGRINRKGVSFLYLSSDAKTAVSEIRGSRGHIITVGQFLNKKNLRIADFRDIDYYKFYESDKEIDDYIFLKQISDFFSIPNPNKNYKVTQCISEAILRLGLDGIMYKSSLSDSNGYNLVIFNKCNFGYIEGSSKVFELEKIKYEYVERNLNIKPEEWYIVRTEKSTMLDEGNAILEKYNSSKY